VRKWGILVLLAGLHGIGSTVQAATCPTPDEFLVAADALPATKAAIARRALTVLTLGGAATLGAPAQGTEYTYPSRLKARLAEALPGVTINIVVLAVPRQSSVDLDARLDAELANTRPSLVIWGPGASAAGRGDDLDTFIGDVARTVGKIQSNGSDLILMTLQYGPSVARVINLPPYRSAVLQAGEMASVPVLDRYELMRFWSDTDFLDLDATAAETRLLVARKLYDCMAEILSKAIVDAVH
jgi:acyl-CoA thioesterase I